MAPLSSPHPTRLLRCLLSLPQGLCTCRFLPPGPWVAGSFFSLRNRLSGHRLPAGLDQHPGLLSSITTALTFTRHLGFCSSVPPLECQLCDARNSVESRAWLAELRPCVESILCISWTLPLDLWACFCCDPRFTGQDPSNKGQDWTQSPAIAPAVCLWPVCPERGLRVDLQRGMWGLGVGGPPSPCAGGGAQNSPISDLEL